MLMKMGMSANHFKILILNFTLLLDEKIYISLEALGPQTLPKNLSTAVMKTIDQMTLKKIAYINKFTKIRRHNHKEHIT